MTREDVNNDRLNMPLSAPTGAAVMARVIVNQSDVHRSKRLAHALQQLGYSAVAADSREHAIELCSEADRATIAFIDLNERPKLITAQANEMRMACGSQAFVAITPADKDQVKVGIPGCDVLIGRRYNDAGLTAGIHRALSMLQQRGTQAAPAAAPAPAVAPAPAPVEHSPATQQANQPAATSQGETPGGGQPAQGGSAGTGSSQLGSAMRQALRRQHR